MNLRTLILALSFIVFCNSVSYAAFPIKEQAVMVISPVVPLTDEDKTMLDAQNEMHASSAPAPTMRGGSGGFPLGAIAMILSSVGMLSIIMALVSAAGASVAFVPLLVAGAALGLAGIVTGAIAANRKDGKGLGIGGLVLGMIDVTITLIITLVAVAIASLFK